jgi:hypothetical protein
MSFASVPTIPDRETCRALGLEKRLICLPADSMCRSKTTGCVVSWLIIPVLTLVQRVVLERITDDAVIGLSNEKPLADQIEDGDVLALR